jgi:hypothetical protein
MSQITHYCGNCRIHFTNSLLDHYNICTEYCSKCDKFFPIKKQHQEECPHRVILPKCGYCRIEVVSLDEHLKRNKKCLQHCEYCNEAVNMDLFYHHKTCSSLFHCEYCKYYGLENKFLHYNRCVSFNAFFNTRKEEELMKYIEFAIYPGNNK